MLRAGNPVMNAFEKPMDYTALSGVDAQPRRMTLQGTINASAVLLGLTACSALATAMLVPPSMMGIAMYGGIIGGLVLALVICFNPRTAPFLGPVYALVEGAALGAISLFYESWAGAQAASADGGGVVSSIGNSIVFQAVILTFGIAGAMLLAYTMRVIRVTPMFVKAVVIMTLGYVFAAVGTFIVRLFGVDIPFLHEMGALGIGIAGFVVVLAAVNLLLDFKVIEDGIQTGQPKYMEWYGAFALTVTLVWLYLRVLYLLAILRRQD